MSRNLSLQAAIKLYGPIYDGAWSDEPKHMTVLDINHYNLPWKNSATNGQVPHIYMNIDLVRPFESAIDNLILRGLENELKTFDGCFHIRDVRGVPGALSAHAYGLAVDINASENPLGGPVKLSPEFLQCFIDAGFDAGANFKRVDPMHFSFCWEGK